MPHMQGQDVQELQSALSKLGPAVPVSGVFDEATAQAVVAYQRSAGLKPDGVVGPATRSALGLV